MITIVLIVVLIIIDQITKYLATAYLQPVGSAPFIPGIMELRYVLNDGAAFSLFSGNKWFLIGFTSVALVVVAVYLYIRNPKMKIERLSLILILAGGIGNLIDRILQGYVVDFFATTFINFAVFNVADCFVVVGAFLLVFITIYDEIKISKLKKQEELEKQKAEENGEKPQNSSEQAKEEYELNSDEIAK